MELAPHNGAIRESRGLNRALVGNIDGAIEDMQFFVTWSPRVAQRAKRERWIRALRAGRKPFGRGELKRLLKED